MSASLNNLVFCFFIPILNLTKYIKVLLTYKRNKTHENQIEHKRLKAIAKRTVKVSKRNAWVEYLSTLNSYTNNKDIWSKIKIIEGFIYSSLKVLKNGDTVINDPDTIANIMSKKFFENSSNSNTTKNF